MNRMLIVAVALAAVLAGAYVGGRSSDVEALRRSPPTVEPPLGATLLPGLGNYHFRITTRNPEAQRWFDQGLMLTYGFNHDAAERSFLRATELDPDCAMCWWGAALVLGPHVNAAMDPANNAKAWQRLQKAIALAPKATPREQAFIHALSARYADSPPEDRKPLDEAYARPTAKLVAQLPERPRRRRVPRRSDDGHCSPGTTTTRTCSPRAIPREIVSTLESVMRAQSRPRRRAAPVRACGRSLGRSATRRGRGRPAAHADSRFRPPGAHAGAHLFARRPLARRRARQPGRDRGRRRLPRRSAAATPRACIRSATCRTTITSCGSPRAWKARSALAQAAAAQTAERTDLPELMRQPGFAGLQHYWMTPWFDRVRFGRWDEIVGVPNPAPDLPYVTAIWHYAQGMAAVRQERARRRRRAPRGAGQAAPPIR